MPEMRANERRARAEREGRMRREERERREQREEEDLEILLKNQARAILT
jgi:hypothetical protein